MRRGATLLLASLAAWPMPAAAEPEFAWVRFDSGRIVASGATGLADRATSRALGIDDPARIASVSKLVVALGVLRLAEQGVVDLDRDVSETLGWRLRNPVFPDQAITLRLLLAHRSGLKDEGDNYVIPLGRTLRDTLANPAVFDAKHAPGSYFRYANLNFPVIASVMERATGERFDRLMQRLVIAPLGIGACFGWASCTPDRVARGVTLYHPDGSVRLDNEAGRRAPCPVASVTPDCDLAAYRPGDNGAIFSPQGGLRISVSDLAVIGQLLLNRGAHDGQRFLKAESIDLLTRGAWRYDGANGDMSNGIYCGYGLGTQLLPSKIAGCDDDLAGDGHALLGHAGNAYGLLSGLWVDRERGTGIAYFAINNDSASGDTGGGYRPTERHLARRIAQ